MKLCEVTRWCSLTTSQVERSLLGTGGSRLGGQNSGGGISMSVRVILKIKNGKFVGKTYEFHGSRRFLIGRGEDCEIRLPHEPDFLTVSRHHCLLEIDPPAIRVQDAGSVNGTSLNGMQIGRPAHWYLPADVLSEPCFEYDLHDGDELKVGDTVFDVDVVVSEDMERAGVEEPATEKELSACV
jgi:pSer/pThr/pTyr-binding forkhead associated (FHA) protein